MLWQNCLYRYVMLLHTCAVVPDDDVKALGLRDLDLDKLTMSCKLYDCS